MRGASIKWAFIAAALLLLLLSLVDGARHGFSARGYVVILAAGFVLFCSSLMRATD